MDRAADRFAALESSQREAIAALVWPDASWLAAGVRSAKQWLITYTGMSVVEARRLERIAELCARDSGVCAAVVDGAMSLGWAEKLAWAVTDERAPWLGDVAGVFVGFAGSDDDFAAAVRYWRERVDEELAPRRVQRQSVVFSNRLFGGGEIHCSLLPVSFENACAAIDAFSQDPDPTDAPYRRTLSERRADGLDDLSVFGLTHDTDDSDLSGEDLDDEATRAEDTFDGGCPGDVLDEALDPANEGLDHLDLLRTRIRKADGHRRRRSARRVRPRSGVTVNAHIDLRTLAGTREITDLDGLVLRGEGWNLDGLVLRGEGWNLAGSAAEQLLCDSSLVATLFDGKTQVLDANDAAERFSKRQRRAIAARDRHCVFPGCGRVPKYCDVHHLAERAAGGPTVVANGTHS